MIIDSLKNIAQYKMILELSRAIDSIVQGNWKEFPLGKTELDGEHLFVYMQEYDSREAKEVRGESHRRYIDLQCVISGEEIIGYQVLEGQEVLEEIPEKDIVFYLNTGMTKLRMKAGMFAVFFPGEIHAPCQISGQRERVKKAVFKIECPTDSKIVMCP